MPNLHCAACGNTTHWQKITMNATGLTGTCGNCGANVADAAASSTSTISFTNLTTTGPAVFGDGEVAVGDVTIGRERSTRRRQERPGRPGPRSHPQPPVPPREDDAGIVFTGPVVFGTNSVAHGDGAQAYGDGSRAYGRGSRAFSGAQAFDETGRPQHDGTEPPATPRPPQPPPGGSSPPHRPADSRGSVNIASDRARVGVQVGPVNIATDHAHVGIQTNTGAGPARDAAPAASQPPSDDPEPPEPDDPPTSAPRPPQPPPGPAGPGSERPVQHPPAPASRGGSGPAGGVSGETRNITATRTFLTQLAAAGDDRRSQAEQAVAALRRLRLDDQTIAEVLGVIDDCAQVAGKARDTLRAMDDKHRLMEEAVAATPQPADRDYYRH